MDEQQKSISELIEIFKKGTHHLENMAIKLDFPWSPDESDSRKLHNMYARNLFTCYVSKFSDLSHGLLSALEKENYLIYALSGRALIETTATLRYYIVDKYKPLLDKGTLTADDMKELISIDDKHLRGTRFKKNRDTSHIS